MDRWTIEEGRRRKTKRRLERWAGRMRMRGGRSERFNSWSLVINWLSIAVSRIG